KRALMARLKSAAKERAAKRSEEEDLHRIVTRTDPRLRVPAPAADAPWLPQMQLLEEVLSNDPSDEPPTRDIEGYVTRVRERSISGLHQLTTYGSNAVDKKDTRLPAPNQLLLARLDRASLGETIERHLDYFDPTNGRSVHLNHAFVDHYLVRDESKLPIVRGTAAMPIVLPDGSIASGPGLDRRLGIVFRVPHSLRKLLPTEEECTPGACARAMRFLLHEWLADVATADYSGRCVIIACALTLLERCILPERPAFFFTAGQRGGGKTTTVNMVSAAALGHCAAAAAWSTNDEERRKALFSYLGAGVPLLAWDNIARGAAIADATIEKVLTAETFTDRTLGVSEFRTVPTSTVLVFTGNNIAPGGDLSSRSLIVRLEVDRP